MREHHKDTIAAALLDYEMTREDERTFIAAQAGALSLAIALFAGFFATIGKTCQLNSTASCTHIPDAALALIPLLPISVLTFIGTNGAIAITRYYYTRSIEVWLRDNIGYELERGLKGSTYRGPVFQELMATQSSFRRGRPIHLLLGTLYISVVLIALVVLLALVASHVSGPSRLLMMTLYFPISVIFFHEIYASLITGRRHFEDTLTRTVDPASNLSSTAHSPDERSLLTYLLLPRPNDFAKIIYAPLGYLIARIALPVDTFDSEHTVVHLVLLIVALEYCVYNARYQLNDVRGYAEDAGLKQGRLRRRLPSTINTEHGIRRGRFNILLSLIVAATRIVFGVAVATTFGLASTGAAVTVVAVLFGITAFYEAAREFVSKTTGRPQSALVVFIWSAVSLGYGLRVGVGLALGGLPLDGQTALVVVAAVVAMANVTVLMTWALEAGGAGTAELVSRPHIGRLTKYFDACRPKTDVDDPSKVPWLSSGSSPLAPWNFALYAAAPLSAVAASAVAAYPALDFHASAAFVSIVLAATLAVCRSSVQRRLAAALAVVVLLVVDGWETYPSALVLIVVAGLYESFASQSYEQVQQTIPALAARIVGLVHRALAAAWRAIIGEATARKYWPGD